MIQVYSLPKRESGIFSIGSSIFVKKTAPTQRAVGAESGFSILLSLNCVFSPKHKWVVCFGKISASSLFLLMYKVLWIVSGGEFNIPSGFSSGNLSLQPYEAY
jgi:hypothetical protein